jgi:hypothetical protein
MASARLPLSARRDAELADTRPFLAGKIFAKRDTTSSATAGFPVEGGIENFCTARPEERPWTKIV